MKRLLLPVLALALCPPAQAVDYVQCESIHRAAARVHAKAAAAFSLVIESIDLATADRHHDYGGDAWAARAAYAPQMEQIRSDAVAAGCPTIPPPLPTKPQPMKGESDCKGTIECATRL